MDTSTLRNTIYTSLLSLVTEEGINASSTKEVYGCIFGRDSAITILKILCIVEIKTVTKEQKKELLSMCQKTLQTIVSLQGVEINMESGEQPGKYIHEFRKNNFDFIIATYGPRFIYPDGYLKNYDSLDSTPLVLIALYRYWEVTHDADFLLRVLPSVERALNWVISYGDMDRDFLLEYKYPKDRQNSGSVVQSWTDSPESLQKSDGRMPEDPIAPIEVQGYAWFALKLWADFYSRPEQTYSYSKGFVQKLEAQAIGIKKAFNRLFVFTENDSLYLSQALTGDKQQIPTVTGNPLLALWATHRKNGKRESIIDPHFIPFVVERAFQEDLFDKDAGIRTMSTQSPTYNPNSDSYHNGSFWPKLNGMAHEALLHWGFEQEAQQLKDASLLPIAYFGSAIESYTKTVDGYKLYENALGHQGCREQAWSAAAILHWLFLSE